MENHWKIVLLPRLQVDAIVACFLLKYFGNEKFPAIEDAEYIFWINMPKEKSLADLENEGYILIDLGEGTFDHHSSLGHGNEKCASELVAEYLGIINDRSLKKILAYARRDDLEGKGTISNDPIDRAFGLSGLVNNLNRMLPDDPSMVLQTIMPLLLAHYLEEKKRNEDFPQEYEKKLESGHAKRFRVPSVRGPITIVAIETNEIGMAGYLRARQNINADIVVQKMSSGHVNIITQQMKNFDLAEIVHQLRKQELSAKGQNVDVSTKELMMPGKILLVEEWYFDTKAKSIQNGGIRPQGTPATNLSLDLIVATIKQGALVLL